MRSFKAAAIVAACVAISACAATQNTVTSLLGRDLGFSGLDKDGDGALSESEVQGVPDLAAAFQELDTDTDGMVNRNEFRAGNTMIIPTNFQRLDINGDGVISRREANASRRSLRETFSTVDADQDGNVSNAEYHAATINLLKEVDFAEADSDGDGVLDRREVERHPLVYAHFDTMDVNSDSLIGPDEFRWAQSN